MIIIDSILHFIIDGICAYSMFGTYGAKGTETYLFYNLCAFALQMPFGALADLVLFKLGRSNGIAIKRFYFSVTFLGVIFTIVGMFAGPLPLGVGNALFHVGAGMSTIKEDRDRNFFGRGLGVFVAPGALGLFVGKSLADFGFPKLYVRNCWIGIAALMVLIGFLRLYYEERKFVFVEAEPVGTVNRVREGIADLITSLIVCFAAVIIRSFMGLTGSFEWKKGFTLAFLATLAVVLGKAAGGFLSHALGELKAVCISMLLSAVCFAFSTKAVFGIFALFFFNMTMPITLYILVRKMPSFPGFAFGLLTFGMFLGFLPEYLDFDLGLSTGVLGLICSLVTMVLLAVILVPEEIRKRRLKRQTEG